MIEGFKSTLPTFEDSLQVSRNMDTTSLATTFPFTSSELTANEGVMYGLNEHNGSLVVFDRFNLENANMVIFAKSGAGKSYAVKLEIMRSLMLGVEVIVLDPENEYRTMCEAVGGSYIPFDFNSTSNIKPFDLSQVYEPGENELGMKILNLHSLIKVMLGELSASEGAVLDRALVLTYKLKGITPDPDSQKNTPPLLEDLYKVLLGMEEAESKGLADRLERYVRGSAEGLFSKPSNIDLNNTFTVFGIRDLEDVIRPVAMFVILDYIWTHIRRNRKKRLLVIDEAWFLMQNPDSAKFVTSVARRGRKYYLGLTTITQNVEDFLETDMGKAVIANSSLQFLMKQSASSVDKLSEVFYLSSGEKNLLLSSNVGEGLFFAGSAHVALQVIASPDEHKLITTNPKELQALADIDVSRKRQISSLLAEETGQSFEEHDEQATAAFSNEATPNYAFPPTPPSESSSALNPPATTTPLWTSSAATDVHAESFDNSNSNETLTAPLPRSDGRIGSPELPLPTPRVNGFNETLPTAQPINLRDTPAVVLDSNQANTTLPPLTHMPDHTQDHETHDYVGQFQPHIASLATEHSGDTVVSPTSLGEGTMPSGNIDIFGEHSSAPLPPGVPERHTPFITSLQPPSGEIRPAQVTPLPQRTSPPRTALQFIQPVDKTKP
jgi:hypothetical protein